MPNVVDQSAWWNSLLTSAILVAITLKDIKAGSQGLAKFEKQLKHFCQL